MAQRQSGYERKAHDFYPTPEWVTRVLADYLAEHGYSCPADLRIWEPAEGSGAMTTVLRKYRWDVHGSDIRGTPSVDFLDPDVGAGFIPHDPKGRDRRINAIITNPPYDKKLCEAFIRKSIRLMEERNGLVAMLLRIDYDSAKTRADMFRDCPAWDAKIVLTKRIKWFETGNKKSPSENHAWYLWNWNHVGRFDRLHTRGGPTIIYRP